MKTNKPKTSKKWSRISKLHAWKLVMRSILLAVAIAVYAVNAIFNTGKPFGGLEDIWWLLYAVALVFVVEIIFRLFPSKHESMGCQKQFRKNYVPNKTDEEPRLTSWKRTALVIAAWLALNGAIGLLYYTNVIDKGILIIISIVYGLSDMICILFFCPFQTWFLKNKCCTTCRIYNWDYAMMATPLVFVPNYLSPGLDDIIIMAVVAAALVMLVVWEILYRVRPRQFAENTNKCLGCAGCQERLCAHKRQLRHFLKKNRKSLYLNGNDTLGEDAEEAKPETVTLGQDIK